MKTPKLKAKDGEGSVVFPSEWDDYDNLLRADILQDWLFDLTNAYNSAVTSFQAEIRDLYPKRKP